MSDMISVKEAASLWGVSPRTVTGLCKSGKIVGAIKNGRDWKIPSDAEKPLDNRIKTGAYVRLPKQQVQIPLPVGISNYRVASTEYYYVDKTLMIKELIDEQPMVTLFTRPRRFGKTLNMDMIRTYFEKTNDDTTKYFTNKKIWQCGFKYRDFQGKYPIVFITLKDVKHKTWDETFENISYIVADEYVRHYELKDSVVLNKNEKIFYEKATSCKLTNVELEQSLYRLSAMLRKHHDEKVAIIIDEYDTPIQSGHSNGFYDKVINFMRNLFSGCFKDNGNLAFGFLTGILRIAKESLFSGLNNLTINSVLDSKYSEYFGFTKDEVRQIAQYYGAIDKMDEISEWYDGYRFGKTDIFNPWSVVNYFNNNCEPRAFWLSTGNNEIIMEMLKDADESIVNNLTSLINGNSFTTYIDTSVIYPEIKNNPSSIYSFLLVAGYLKAIKSSISISGDFICEVALPNKEITLVYRKEILQRLSNMIPQATAIIVEEALFTGDSIKLKEIIQCFLRQSVSSFETNKESFYNGFMLGLCTLFGSFYISYNRESGEGRYDIQLMPKKETLPGIIIELKAMNNCDDDTLKALAHKALEQINAKKYATEMKTKGIKTIYKYGVAFSGKDVEIISE